MNDKIRQVVDDHVTQLRTSIPKMIAVSTPVLPAGARFYATQGDAGVIAVEQKPCVRTLQFANVFKYGEDERRLLTSDEQDQLELGSGLYTVALPYVIFVVRFTTAGDLALFQSLNVYYRTAPLLQLSDQLLEAALPNVSNDKACLGRGDDALERQPLADLVERVVRAFWERGFNLAYPTQFNYVRKAEPRLSSLDRWVKESAADPSFPLRVDFRQTGKSLAYWNIFREQIGITLDSFRLGLQAGLDALGD